MKPLGESDCCRDQLILGGDSIEGTHFYVCRACGKECNIYVKSMKQTVEEIIKECRPKGFKSRIDGKRNKTEGEVVEFMLDIYEQNLLSTLKGDK
jgi:hypothetical protein